MNALKTSFQTTDSQSKTLPLPTNSEPLLEKIAHIQSLIPLKTRTVKVKIALDNFTKEIISQDHQNDLQGIQANIIERQNQLALILGQLNHSALFSLFQSLDSSSYFHSDFSRIIKLFNQIAKRGHDFSEITYTYNELRKIFLKYNDTEALQKADQYIVRNTTIGKHGSYDYNDFIIHYIRSYPGELEDIQKIQEILQNNLYSIPPQHLNRYSTQWDRTELVIHTYIQSHKLSNVENAINLWRTLRNQTNRFTAICYTSDQQKCITRIILNLLNHGYVNHAKQLATLDKSNIHSSWEKYKITRGFQKAGSFNYASRIQSKLPFLWRILSLTSSIFYRLSSLFNR